MVKSEEARIQADGKMAVMINGEGNTEGRTLYLRAWTKRRNTQMIPTVAESNIIPHL